MSGGPSLSADTAPSIATTAEFRAPGNNFTPFGENLLRQAGETMTKPPEYSSATETGMQGYSKPTTTPHVDELMAEIMGEANGAKPKEALPDQSTENPRKKDQVHKTWLQKISDWFWNLFR